MTCTVEGCGSPVRCKGYCNRHYKLWRTHGDPTIRKTGGGPRKYPVGTRIGRLTVTGYDAAAYKYELRCDCGNTTKAEAGALTKGTTVSCGCYAAEQIRIRATTHGHARHGQVSPTYKSWTAMRRRCQNPRHHKYPLYGGRGIKVCDRWQRFENFLADMGERPEGTTIDRIDSGGNYEPGNCRWADATVQSRNRDTAGPPRVVHVGDRFGSLMVLGDAPGHTAAGGPKHRCQCDCGKIIVTDTGKLRSGRKYRCSRSCTAFST